MGKKLRYLCTRCERRLNEGQAFCASCTYPTQWASHEEKVEWELAQYEAARAVAAHPDFDKMQAAPPPVRRTLRPALAPRPAPSEPVVRAAEVVPVRPRVAKPATQLPPVPDPTDDGVLLKVMRLLNARITELESRIEELEAEVAPHRRSAERG